MLSIVLDEADGEMFSSGPFRLRVLAQGADRPIGIIETTVPAGFPGPVRRRHAEMTDIFYVLEGLWSLT